ncbi:MAG: hypothetical protein O7E52_03105 [Candidatus Poribacteria bacterium]|nr:hypothetical protein [Candidatus Poribacteria bacterium]
MEFIKFRNCHILFGGKQMKNVNVKCLICIIVFALTVVNQAESERAAPDLVSLAVVGELVIVGKLLAAEVIVGKLDDQTQVVYTDVIVEVVQVIRNTTEQEIKVGSTINFRPLGGQIGNRKGGIVGDAEFGKEEIGNLLLLSLIRPHRATAGGKMGFDTIFDVFGGEDGKHTIKIKDNVPMVHLFWMERRDAEIGLPLDWVLELMNTAITLASKSPVQNPKTPDDVPAEVKFKFRRLSSIEKSVRQAAWDGLSEARIIRIARAELARVKEELGL